MFSPSESNRRLQALLQPLLMSGKKIKSSTLLCAYVLLREITRLHDSSPNDSFAVCYSRLLSLPQYEGILLPLDFSPQASSTLDKAVGAFSSFDLCSFLRFITPDLVAQPVEFCKYFDRKGIDLPQACQHIIRIKMSKISSDQQAKAATSADVLDRIFSAYEQIRGYGPDLPDIENGTKETNLNRYGGDFFRENFRHWALAFANLTPDEVQYLLGNKPETTFGIFYCDYLNEASQLLMHVKLQRLDAFLRRENAGGKIYRLPAQNKLHKDFAPAGSYPRQLIVSLSPARKKHPSPIVINLHSLHGADYYADCLSISDE